MIITKGKVTEIIIKVDDSLLEQTKLKGMESKYELIRCKDCKHWYKGLNINYCRIFYDDNLKLYQCRPDDYCSRAERKEE